MADESLEVRRSYHARREEVFRAWTEAEKLARWLVPARLHVADAEAEPHVGGKLRVVLADDAGHAAEIRGEYRELEAPARLVLSLGFQRGQDLLGPSRVEVTLAEEDGRCELVLRHAGLGEAERPELAAAWGACLGRLPAALDEALERFFGRVTSQPRPLSPFGGFWPDVDDPEPRIAGRAELGLLDAAGAELFRHWAAKGYVVLEGAVDPAAIDRLTAEVDGLWERGDERVQIEVFRDGARRFAHVAPEHRDAPHKVLDLHGHSEAAREVVFAPALRDFLVQLFERPPMAFQSLLFDVGTEQDMHQDTAYVLVRSPMEFVGTWIALEDVERGSGELRYYEGSHRIPEYLWFGRARAKPYDYADEAEFLRWMHDKPRELGCPLVHFAPKKGDVLVWHAGLVHGGAPRERQDLTRKSLVTHFCPVDVDPEWYGTTEHTEKVRHASGSYFCHLTARRG